jgi:hypothetical protein
MDRKVAKGEEVKEEKNLFNLFDLAVALGAEAAIGAEAVLVGRFSDECPSEVDAKQLEELHILIKR